MKGKKLPIYIGFSVLMVVLSFVIYYGFSNVEKTSMQNVAFGFVVMAEVVFFGMIYVSSNEKHTTFLKAGIISASSIYMLASLVLNLILKAMFTQVRILVTLNIIFLVLYIGIILLLFLVKKES